MDKTGHLVTVPREYLEELERFKEENRTDLNAKVSERGVSHYGTKAIFLEVDSLVAIDFFNNLIVVDKEGNEIAKFVNVI